MSTGTAKEVEKLTQEIQEYDPDYIAEQMAKATELTRKKVDKRKKKEVEAYNTELSKLDWLLLMKICQLKLLTMLEGGQND